MNNWLFKDTILNIDKWNTLKQSHKNFLPLVKYICDINKIYFDASSLFHEPPFSVFRIKNFIIKIFNPPEANFWNEPEYNTESEALKFCKNIGVHTPEIIHNGIVYDKIYSFPYIIMNYIEGVNVKKAIPYLSLSEKMDLLFELKEIKERISVVTDIKIKHCNDPDRINHRLWNHLPESFLYERRLYILNINISEFVFNHGDLNDTNIIIDKRGHLNLIDFAESVIAPSYYDMGSIILCLGYDPILLDRYFNDYNNDDFYEKLTASYVTHFWGGVHINEIATDIGINILTIKSINDLKSILKNWLVKKLIENK